MPKASRTTRRARAAKQPRAIQRYAQIEEMPIMHPHAAGIDLAGAADHYVAYDVPGAVEVRAFGGTTDEVRALVADLVVHGITTVAMEATGVYWMVVADLLEAAGIEVYLVNPSHLKRVPGRRKDDKLDSRWLLTLHKHGLLSASFRPARSDRPLQQLYRHRTALIRHAADEVRRMQKALDIMNVRLHKAVTDLTGVTGLRILRAILAGEHRPAVLATMRDPHCACTEEELCAALTGHFLPAQLLIVRQGLAHDEQYQRDVTEVDAAIEAELCQMLPHLTAAEAKAAAAAVPTPPDHAKHAPACPVVGFLTLITGVDATTLPGIAAGNALGLVATLGRDLSKFPTAKAFTSYLGLVPVPQISGGKMRSSKTQPGVPPAALLFKQAAAAVIRTDTALGAFYRRLAVRIGSGKALTATARKIAVQYYHLQRDGQAYVEEGAARYEARYRQQQITYVRKKAAQLGLEVREVA